MHVDIISMELPIWYFEGSQVEIYNQQCISVMKIFFFANSADPDEMLHGLPKYLFCRYPE